MVKHLHILVLLALPTLGASIGAAHIQMAGTSKHFGYSAWDRMARMASNQVSTLLTANGADRVFWSGTVPPVSAGNWARTIDFSGLSRDGSFDVALITRRHGITAAHYGSPSGEIVFRSLQGEWTTNAVESTSNPISDIRVVTLVSNVPSFIEPFAVMPTNWWNYGSNALWGSSLWLAETNPMACVYVRNNTASLGLADWQQAYVFSGGTYYWGYFCAETRFASTWIDDSPLYVSETLTGGDSGGPIFMLLEGRAIFLAAIHFSNRSGPCISYPPNFEAVQAAIAPEEMTVFELRLYGL